MKRIRVLVVDDDALVRSALATLIRQQPDLELCGAAAGPVEAGRLAATTFPDVALVDVRMPKGGGPRAAADVMQRSPATKVVALSAAEDRKSVLEMLTAGAVGYAVKSEAPCNVVAAIRNAAAGNASISPRVAAPVIGELTQRLRADASVERSRLDKRSRIDGALARGDPRCAFQPIVDLSSGSTVGVEALARFTAHPVRSPDLWFAEAASVGLGRELETRAAFNALEEARALPRHWFVSLNMSPDVILSFDARALVDATDRPVVLEITEHAPVRDYDAVMEALRGFRAAGGRVAIDDAGAGFSSCRHILQLSPDLIKLDISLTRGVGSDAKKGALAAAFVSYGREADALVVAEGIETPAELAALEAIGATYGQGYLWSPPLPSEDLLEVMERVS